MGVETRFMGFEVGGWDRAVPRTHRGARPPDIPAGIVQ